MEKRTMRRSWVLGLCAVMLVSVSTAWAANLYVSPTGGGDGSKSSPMSLQSALDVANSSSENHTLFLQQGTYDASAVGGFSIEEIGLTAEKWIRLSGGWDVTYANQSGDVQVTKLDGNNTTRVLNLAVQGGTADTAMTYYLERLTIEKGYIYGDNGAGIKISNHATDGGYINVYISECLIRNNHARKNVSVGGNGGGLFSRGYVEVLNTTFESNSSDYHGAAIFFSYQSPYTKSLSPKVLGSTFLNNYNAGCCPQGSAIYAGVSLTVIGTYFEGQTGSGSPIFSAFGGAPYLNVYDSKFYNNQTTYWGSAIQFWDTPGNIRNCVFIQNHAGYSSDGYGAITYYNNSGEPEDITITNCTFTGNRSLSGGGGWGGALHSRGGNLTISNSIFWDNGPEGLYSQSGDATITHSDIEGGFSGTGFTDGGNNISANPLLVAPDDYQLATGSPCIDTGENASVTAGTDVDGNIRFYDGDGNGSVIVDMGADELSPSLSVSPSSHDFGDVTVGTTSSEQVFTLSNTSSLPLVISSSIVMGNDDGIDLHPGGSDPCPGPLPVTLPPNTSCTLAGTFSPGTTGARYATQKLYSNDPDTPINSFTVTGIGVSDSYAKVKLLSPNGAEVIPSGSLYLVRWGAPGTAASFKIKYSLDNGLTWKNPTDDIVNGETSYIWDIPTLTKNAKKCLLSVTGFAGPNATGAKVGSDRSDMPFKIDVVLLVTPNGKEKITSNTLHDIRWETGSTAASVASVELYYTRDGTVTWIKIPVTIQGNPGRYTWTVPPKKGTQCKVKVVLKDGAGKTLGNDVSDGFFAIRPALIP